MPRIYHPDPVPLKPTQRFSTVYICLYTHKCGRACVFHRFMHKVREMSFVREHTENNRYPPETVVISSVVVVVPFSRSSSSRRIKWVPRARRDRDARERWRNPSVRVTVVAVVYRPLRRRMRFMRQYTCLRRVVRVKRCLRTHGGLTRSVPHARRTRDRFRRPADTVYRPGVSLPSMRLAIRKSRVFDFAVASLKDAKKILIRNFLYFQ